jgi:hypothetical protein
MSVSRDELLGWFGEIGWLVVSEGPRSDKKPGVSIFAMSPVGLFKDFRCGENGQVEAVEELH